MTKQEKGYEPRKKSTMFHSISMTRVAATIAACLGAEAPRQADRPIGFVEDLVAGALGGKADRVLVYNPDCVPLWLYQKYTERFRPVLAAAGLTYLKPRPAILSPSPS